MLNFILSVWLLLITLTVGAQQAYAPFLHGVASGDPLADRIILWTHVSPTDSTQPIMVNWRIATDASFSNIINSGNFTTDSSRDFTVKEDASGLQPATTYYYDFETRGNHSAVGVTKTAPIGNIANVRFAVVTCAKYSKGYFNSYGRVGDRDDIDAVVHLGDYIYESEDSGDVGRVMLPFARCSTLVQFRTRYAQYHTDQDLVNARQHHPFINVWDDHETGNDSWPHGSEHFPDSAQFDALKAAAQKAYFEWVPIREDSVHPNRIYRTFQYGDLIDLIMLDTRMEGRMEQVPLDSAHAAALNDSNRTILGHEQYNWLINKLDSSTARWRIIGQQVMMAPALFYGQPLNNDQWDGYPAERAKLFKHLDDNQMNNVVVLTGDVHAAMANDLPKDPSQYVDATGEGSAAVEFITPAIVSSKSDLDFPFSTIKLHDPHIQYAAFENGYMILDVTASKVQGDFYFVGSTDVPDTTQRLDTSFYTLYGSRHFYRNPVSVNPLILSENPSIEIYPNPTDGDNLSVQVINTLEGKITFKIYNLEGRMMKKEVIELPTPGGDQVHLKIAGLNRGLFLLKAYSGTREFYSAKFTVAE